MNIYKASGELIRDGEVDIEAIARQIGIGNPCKTPFGHPQNNRWRRGIFRGIGNQHLGRIEVKYRGKTIIISRPMCDIYPENW